MGTPPSLARAAGIRIPYPNFTDPAVQQFRTVAQALRPFPQFQTIATAAVGGGGIGAGNGDRSGHSSYHGLLLRVQRRFAGGLTGQWSYTFSKLLTDAGVSVIVDATAPRRVWREAARAMIPSFAEIQLLCPTDVCLERERAVRWGLTFEDGKLCL